MKRTLAAVIAVALGTAVFVTPALSWEKGTHLYIADKLKKQGGMNPSNMDEMYGAMAPDIFNYVFDLPAEVYAWLYDQTHHQYINMWKAVKWGYEKPLAFGFVSHNDTWGADRTAHHLALTTGLNEGYIITKANLLVAAIDWASLEAVVGAHRRRRPARGLPQHRRGGGRRRPQAVLSPARPEPRRGRVAVRQEVPGPVPQGLAPRPHGAPRERERGPGCPSERRIGLPDVSGRHVRLAPPTERGRRR